MQCLSCDSTSNRTLQSNKCTCNTGFYEIGAPKCLPCKQTCLTCISQNDQFLNGSVCECKPGYFDDGNQLCQCNYNYYTIECDQSSQITTSVLALRDSMMMELRYAKNAHINAQIVQAQRIIAPSALQTLDISEIILYLPVDVQMDTLMMESRLFVNVNHFILYLECSPKYNCLVCESQLIRKSSPQCNCKEGYFEDQQQKFVQEIQRIVPLVSQIGLLNSVYAKMVIMRQIKFNANHVAINAPHALNIHRINPPNCICQDHYYDDFSAINIVESNSKSKDLHLSCRFNILYFYTILLKYFQLFIFIDCDVAVVQGIFSDDLSELIYTFEYELQFNFLTQVDAQEYCQYLIQEQSLQLIGEVTIMQNRIKQTDIGDILQFKPESFKTYLMLNTSQHQLSIKNYNHQHNCQIPRLQSIILNFLFLHAHPLKYPQYNKMQVVKETQNQNGHHHYPYLPLILLTNTSFQLYPQNQDILISFTNFLEQSDSLNIQFQTLSASVPQLQFKTIKKSYISWAPIKVLVQFSNTICTQGAFRQISNPVQILFEEIVDSRSPLSSNPIQFQQSSFDSEESEGSISTFIPARTLSVNTNYSILSKLQDLKSRQEVTALLDIQIERSPLMVQIVGVLIESKDPDSQTEWNEDPEIILSVQCIDLQHQNRPCIDQFDKVIHLNKTSNIQFIAAKLFKPFTVLLFKVDCQKKDLNATTSANIIMLDVEVPTINISYPQGYKIRDVNNNEKLKFQILIDRNEKFSDYDFSYALVPNQIIEFALWEGFERFGFINQISVRLQAHNVKYLMPQIAQVTLTVNTPPVNSITSIQPQEGNALFTQFTMRITNAKDKDLPLEYRYSYYESWQLYQKDLLSGQLENLIILQDFTTRQIFSTILESGNLTIVLTVSDSLGSQANFTQQVYTKSLYEQWYDRISHIQQVSNEINDSSIVSSECKQMVSELQISQGDTQFLITVSQELIKLLKNNIQTDCYKAINQQLEKLQLILYDLLLKSANTIIKSRISNIARIPIEFTDQLQINQLAQIEQNHSDSEDVIRNISQIQIQVLKAIEINSNLTKDLETTYDLGDDQTFIIKYFIKNKLHKSTRKSIQYCIVISTMIDQLMDSFRPNLILDNHEIIVSTNGLGLQVYKQNIQINFNRIGQKRFQSFIIQNYYDFEEVDLSNFIINRYIQLAKYKSNKYFYTENFKKTFENGSFLLFKEETNVSIYEKTIIPYPDSIMIDPQIYVDNINQVTQVEKLHIGKLAFNMGATFNTCNSYDYQLDSKISHTIICSIARLNYLLIITVKFQQNAIANNQSLQQSNQAIDNSLEAIQYRRAYLFNN
ncbi:hypothetical protein pb186bvf_021097 [Paramecium bursaria]